MIAGLNVKGTIWKITTTTDDSSGGAVVSGTAVHMNVNARLQQQPMEMLLLQQGLETRKVWNIILAPVTLDIEERYEFEVTYPTNYYLYGKRLLLTNVRPADFPPADKRNYLLATAIFIEKSHV